MSPRKQKKVKKETVSKNDDLFLPDFCSIRSIFVVVLIGEMLAILLTLAGNTNLSSSFGYLGLISFFILWIVLLSCALLCWTRPYLSNLSQVQAGFIAFFTIQIITGSLSCLVLYLMQQGIDKTYFDTIIPSGFIAGNLIISTMISALLLRYFYIQHNWKWQIKAEAEARVQALQSRIRPHFLFNSMNIIASLTRSDPALAERTVLDLSDLFRANLSGNKNHSKWQDELQLSQQYLRIEELRLDNRLFIEWKVDAFPDDALLPALTLQPLLENAIYHGIEPLSDGGTILIRANRAGNHLSLLIENPLQEEHDKNGQHGNQIAQDNVRQRLALFFQERSSLKAKIINNRYNVTLTFPYITSL